MNIGEKSARWLESVGIHSPDDFFDLGPLETFKRVKEAYPDLVSMNMLYVLQGAYMDLPWNELPEDIVEKLKKEFAE
jgi:hypothetical protein